MSDRETIAELVSTVDDVTGFAFRPANSSNFGDAWVLLEGMEVGPVMDYEIIYRLVVVLTADEEFAMSWFVDNAKAIAASLEDFVRVERIEPGTVDTEAGERYAMILRLRKEA